MNKARYFFGPASETHLKGCDPKLIHLARLVVRYRDCAVIEGFRGEEKQNAAFNAGLSHRRWPDSEHNERPSRAIHIVPYNANRDPYVDWKNEDEFRVFGGFVLCMAITNDIDIIWGGDWDSDGNPRNQTLHDLAHYELIDS